MKSGIVSMRMLQHTMLGMMPSPSKGKTVPMASPTPTTFPS